MEYFDATTIFLAGLALGFIAGRWLRKQDLRLEYERGRLAGINEVWPHLVRAWVDALRARLGKPAGDPAPGGDASA